MMVACASVCNSGPEPSAPEAGLSSLDVLVPQQLGPTASGQSGLGFTSGLGFRV